jgi:hypothetical protein
MKSLLILFSWCFSLTYLRTTSFPPIMTIDKFDLAHKSEGVISVLINCHPNPTEDSYCLQFLVEFPKYTIDEV